MNRRGWAFLALVVSSLILVSCATTPTPTPLMPSGELISPTPQLRHDSTPESAAETPVQAATATSKPAATAASLATETALPTATETPATPLSFISRDSLFGYLDDLTNIEPYSGWRNSATEGEAEALEYVAGTLADFAYLQELGMELERQRFHVFLATEIWESRLYMTKQGQETEVPADTIRGHRHDVAQALRFDSDGTLNDLERNPVQVDGEVALIRSAGEVEPLSAVDLKGKIVFLDYAAIDPLLVSPEDGRRLVADLIDKEIAGMVLVTQFSEKATESHGSRIGGGLVLEGVTTERTVPTLYVRLEDLDPAGIAAWEDLADIEGARFVWDTDVLSPGTSGNLVARIPGTDTSQAMILGAHIDSPNSPGAIDNGINSVALLELARILNETQTQPAVDLYMVWFGSEELWVYGSQHFVNTHQELLDRTIGAFLMDAIIANTPDPYLELIGWSYSRFGNDQLTFSDYIAQRAASHGILFDEVSESQAIGSDDGVFHGFVPTIGFAFGSEVGGYAHSPYDTVEMARGLGDMMEQVTSVALIVALETGQDQPDLRVTPKPDRRALIVGTHTEVAQMTSTALINMDRALAWEGFDVDAIPYGHSVTQADLVDVQLVVVLPAIDYPGAGGDLTLYDEAWSEEEIEALVTYVEQGGLLLLANSANRIQLFGLAFDVNEDWQKVNALSAHFGVVFEEGQLAASRSLVQKGHPLVENLTGLTLIADNGVPFTMENGQALALAGEIPVVGLVEQGENGGQVLVLADVGILGFAGAEEPPRDNFEFLRNLARYARSR